MPTDRPDYAALMGELMERLREVPSSAPNLDGLVGQTVWRNKEPATVVGGFVEDYGITLLVMLNATKALAHWRYDTVEVGHGYY